MSQKIRFGTDGWRAIIGDDFTFENVRRVAAAAGRIWARLAREENKPNTIIVGYDTRFEAASFAQAAAEVLASCGLEVILSDSSLPTPALCYSVSVDEQALGGMQLTASHNPAKWLGIKIRMEDGGASPVEFTQLIEEEIEREAKEVNYLHAPEFDHSLIKIENLGAAYIETLLSRVDLEAIGAYTATNPDFKVLVDPLYGAGQGYLSEALTRAGIPNIEIHDKKNPGFHGLHPEPIPPWTDKAAEKTLRLGTKAAFVTDGDADRIGAIDEKGNFVSPHKIIALVAMHLNEYKSQTGRIVKTLSTSTTIDRLAEHLNCACTTTPIGFKWIYEEMQEGDVLIGGEESGGIGIPSHVKERDGLLMALLLSEMMVVRDKALSELVDELHSIVGEMFYTRSDLRLGASVKDSFVASIPELEVSKVAGRDVLSTDKSDGIKLHFADDEWLLLRPSGTEPLVRVYAEANTTEALAALISAGCALVKNQGAK